MIVFGGNQMAPFLYDDDKLLEPKWFKYNFMNINMIGTDISCMWPTKEMLQLYDLDSPDFDRAYADYLINNDRAFIGFMLPLTGHYYNHASFVLTDLDSPPVLSMIESVCKLIQYRYGMNSILVNEPDDMLDLDSTNDIGEEYMGVFMQDLDRFTYLTTDISELNHNTDLLESENAKYL